MNNSNKVSKTNLLNLIKNKKNTNNIYISKDIDLIDLKKYQKGITGGINDLRIECSSQDYSNTGKSDGYFIVDKEGANVMLLNDYYGDINHNKAKEILEDIKNGKVQIPKISPNLTIPDQFKGFARKVKDYNRIVYKTDNAQRIFKGQTIFGYGKYYSLKKEDCIKISGSDTDVYDFELPIGLKLLEIVVDNDWYEQGKKSLLWKDSFQKAIIDKGFDGVIVKVYNDPDFNLAGDQLVIYKPLWENDLIQQAKKYESADDFISSEPEIEVSIDDLIPTEGHTYDNTIKKHGGPRKEFAKKPPYVLLKKNRKFRIIDGNHRYFLAKEEGKKIIKVKLENFFPVNDEEKTHLNILKEIWKKANNDGNKSEKDDELEKAI